MLMDLESATTTQKTMAGAADLNSPSHRLQMLMSEYTLSRLSFIRDVTEATSYGEVVRRALQLFEEMIELYDINVSSQEEGTGEYRQSVRIQVVLPEKSMERLQRLKNKMPGASFAEIIRRALSVYAEFCSARKEKKSWIAKTEDGKELSVSPHLRIN
jgi:hypothetical protein